MILRHVIDEETILLLDKDNQYRHNIILLKGQSSLH